MEKRQLGSTDMKVSRLACGGLFISKVGATFEQGKEAVKHAAARGMNYFDTAPGYADSEEVLGQFLKEVDVPYYLSTKLGGRPTPFNPKDKDQLYFSFERSLKLLGRDQMDVLFIHEPDRPGQYEWWEDTEAYIGPVTEVLADLKARGLIRYTGLGGTTVYQMTRIIERADFDVLLTAFNYSLLFREAAPLIKKAKAKGMGIVAGSPLQQGWFARREDDAIRNAPPAWMAPERREQLLALYELCDAIDMPLPELGLRFVLSNPHVDTVLSGVRKAAEVEQNANAAESGPLSADVLARLDEIAAVVPFRPYEEPAHLAISGYRGPGMLR